AARGSMTVRLGPLWRRAPAVAGPRLEAPPVMFAAADSSRIAAPRSWPGAPPGLGNEHAVLRYLRTRSLSSRRKPAGGRRRRAGFRRSGVSRGAAAVKGP